jgi:hypothetical protein
MSTDARTDVDKYLSRIADIRSELADYRADHCTVDENGMEVSTYHDHEYAMSEFNDALASAGQRLADAVTRMLENEKTDG